MAHLGLGTTEYFDSVILVAVKYPKHKIYLPICQEPENSLLYYRYVRPNLFNNSSNISSNESVVVLWKDLFWMLSGLTEAGIDAVGS